MTPWIKFAIFALFSFQAARAAVAPTLEKTTAYYYDRYGAPISDQLVPKKSFYAPTLSTWVELKGPFIIRTYKKDNLRTEVVFSHPGLKAISVLYSLNTTWTSEQALAALTAYSQNWVVKQEDLRAAYFTSTRGDVAQMMLTQLHVLSSGLCAELLAADSRNQSERRKVPKF